MLIPQRETDRRRGREDIYLWFLFSFLLRNRHLFMFCFGNWVVVPKIKKKIYDIT